MKKSAKNLLSIIIFIFAILAFAWPYIKMELASSAYYTQYNEREYEYYTPDLLKNMPRISDKYEFAFGNVSGPQAQVFTIRFQDTNDAKKVRDYLTSAGYKPQTNCHVEAECWRIEGSRDVVSVINYHSPDSIAVQIYRSPDTE